MPIKFKILMSFLALGALFSVYSLTNSLKSNINITLPRALNTNLPSGLEEDADHDGLSNTDESYWATEWQNSDTDGDGFLDGEEVASGHDPRKAGPDDLLAKTNGFIKSGNDENLTEKLSSLITAGLYAGDLQKTASDKTYETAIKSLSLAILDQGFAMLNPPAQIENKTSIPASKENQKNYVLGIIKAEKELVREVFNDVFGATDVLREFDVQNPDKNQEISKYFLSKAAVFSRTINDINNLAVPSSWEKLHSELLNLLQSFNASYLAISEADKDPTKAVLATRNLQIILADSRQMVTKLSKKIKENGIEITDDAFGDLIKDIANEL